MLDAVIDWKPSASSPNTTKRKTVMVQNSELSKPPNPKAPFVRQFINPTPGDGAEGLTVLA